LTQFEIYFLQFMPPLRSGGAYEILYINENIKIKKMLYAPKVQQNIL